MSKLSKEDEAIYMAAFGKSKAKTVKERMAAGDAAVAAKKSGAMKAVEGGIKEGSIRKGVAARIKKFD